MAQVWGEVAYDKQLPISWKLGEKDLCIQPRSVGIGSSDRQASVRAMESAVADLLERHDDSSLQDYVTTYDINGVKFLITNVRILGVDRERRSSLWGGLLRNLEGRREQKGDLVDEIVDAESSSFGRLLDGLYIFFSTGLALVTSGGDPYAADKAYERSYRRRRVARLIKCFGGDYEAI